MKVNEDQFPKASRNTDPVTSHIAEAKITASGQRQRQCDMVLEYVRNNPGLTSKELSTVSAVTDRYTFSRRLPDLESKGLVVRGPIRKCSVGGQLSLTWYSVPKQGQLELVPW